MKGRRTIACGVLVLEFTAMRDDPLFTPGNEVAPERFTRFERLVE